MDSYLSLVLYVLTFVGGFLLDTPSYRNNCKLRLVYVVWLYVFLCFGYMTGADWRNYEKEFYDWNNTFTKDYGYVYTINALHYLFGDFWIVYDGFRCLYLWSVIRLLKYLTRYWLSAVSFLLPMSLLTLTIDSPFRFMIALTFLNIAIVYLIKSRYLPAIILCMIAVTFHLTMILLIPFLFFLKNDWLVKVNNWVLLALYFFVIAFTANLDRITNLHNLIGLAFSDFGLNSYNSYEAESGVDVLTFGLILQSIIFIFVINTKVIVAKYTPNGFIIANMAILYFFVQRFGIAIPTGHRFSWLFTVFLAVYFANLFHVKGFKGYHNIALFRNRVVRNLNLLFIIALVYYGGSMTKTIVNHFAYIPYSNSIPYIISGHKPYNERVYYNLDAYRHRTGKRYELNTDEYQ